MKGLIPAGGAGTRLRPITHTSAKQLVPVANKPILFYGIEDMARAGITDIGIVVGENRDEIMQAVGEGTRFGVEVTYIHQDVPLGLAHCVLVSGDFLADDDFVMYLGDNMLQDDLGQFVQRFRSAETAERLEPPVAQILLAHVEDPRQFGVVELDDHGEIVRLIEKPVDPPSDLALVGVYLFDRRIHDAVRAIKPSARGELEITDAIQWLLDQGHRVAHEILVGWWIDTGKKDTLLESNRRILETIEPRVEGFVDHRSTLEGRVIVEEGAEVIASRVIGPSIVGARSRVVDSDIGPFTSIASECEILDSALDHCVVLESSRVSGVRTMTDSLIGRSVEVIGSTRHATKLRLMLGDHSQVDLG